MAGKLLRVKVVKISGDKTVAALHVSKKQHAVYKKYVKSYRKYLAHDEKGSVKVGDEIFIAECRPISRRKRWRVVYEDAA